MRKSLDGLQTAQSSRTLECYTTEAVTRMQMVNDIQKQEEQL